MSSIFITGDIHAGKTIHCLNNRNFPEGKTLCRNDYVIVAGDFGLPWCNDAEDKYWLNWLAQKTYTVLFIDGNHENYANLYNYPTDTWHGGMIRILEDNIFHLCRGQVYDFGGIRTFCFGGARSHDIQYRKEGISWWKEELPNQMEYDEAINNLDACNWNVDLVLTHTAPKRFISPLLQAPYEVNEETQLHQFFEDVDSRLTYEHWYFGHFHQDVTLDEKHTVVYNKVHRFR